MKSKLLLITIIALALLFFPKINYGQAPTLGTTADFALFTTVGLVRNDAIYVYNTRITGNVGSNSGAVTGFGNVDGTMAYPSDPISMQAEVDLLATETQLDAAVQTNVPPGVSLGAPGAGQTLFAGVHEMTNPVLTLAGNLNLDALNDPTKVFIFKMHGALVSTSFAKVKLINGALACNVFWITDGAVDLADNTSMKGTILARGAIHLAIHDTLEGRALAKNGEITVTDGVFRTPIGCNSPILTGPVRPNLASLECFTIFSSNGALTNGSPAATSIGDVGNNGIGAITGWDASMVTGTLHDVFPDIATATAATDLSNVYNYINTLPVDIELLAPMFLGYDLVLTPHVYHMTGSALITDTIILNGLGDANAVFVIKITAGDLATYAGAAVKLINGTQAQNVFWLVSGGSGVVEITDNVTFRGNIIVPNGAINMRYTGVVLDGRALTMVGAISTQGLTAIMPPGCGSSPIVVTDPINDTVCVGDTAMFSVIATGTNLTYQWMNGNTPLVNSSHISGADSATLYIYSAGVSDTSSFYNVIINGSIMPSDTSINVSLTVNTPVNITSQPISTQTVCAGDSAMFTVVATGTGLTYQWRKGSVDLINGLNISGTDSSTLTIHNISTSDTAYNYNVIVSGTCTKDTSINAALIVNTAPNITTQPSNQIACEGSATSFTVVGTGAGLTYQWRKGNATIIGATSATLSINPVSITDTASNYNVIIMGTCGTNDTSINVSLTVNMLPNITTQPSNDTICVGDSASFSVIATGTGITYQWRKGNTIILGATSSTFTINPANVSDTASNYNVIVMGTCLPNDTSINVSLVVNQIPVAIATSNSPVCIDSTITLMAQTVVGATYAWTGPDAYTSMVQNPTISSATLLEAGTYSLTVIQNGCSSVTVFDTVVVYNCGGADLSVVKTVNELHPFVGHTVVFTIVATNNGNLNASGVTTTDILQSGYTYVSSTTTTGTYNTSTGLWTIGTLNNGASETLTITATVNASGSYANTASITGNEIDTNLVNNTSTVTTVPTDFFIPEGFSPNGDGINDVFVIRGIEYYPANTFTIFNRWGNKVFEANHYLNTWNGTTTEGIRVGGNQLPVGTYFYTLDLGDGTTVFKGTIYLNN
jgi:gliding motility-associated-like protein/uncharacterized repeat protein (TIGR01451 family)